MCDTTMLINPGIVNLIAPNWVLLCMSLVLLPFVSDHLKMQEMCNKAVAFNLYMLDEIPDHFKTQTMCNEAVRREPWLLKIIPDLFKTEEMWIKAVEVDS